MYIHTHIRYARKQTLLGPVRIARIHVTRFSPRVGLPRQLYLIGNLTAALRFAKGWVRKDANLGSRIGRTSTGRLTDVRLSQTLDWKLPDSG